MQRPEFIACDNLEWIEINKKEGVAFLDTFSAQLDELCEIRSPLLRDEPDQMNLTKEKFRNDNKESGIWCYLPWLKKAIKILSEEYYFEVRTARNRNLITKEEQDKFRQSRIAVAGLSVGSNIALLNVLQGGAQNINLADYDVLGLSNLNRIVAGIGDLGEEKSKILARKLYELDPFLNLNLFSEGINIESSDNFFHIDGQLVDVIVEEIDNIDMKIELRKKAEQCKIPLFSITDNGDGVIVDIERYDKGYNFSDFAKRLESLGDKKIDIKLSSQEIAQMVTKFIGAEDVELRMLDSIMQVGKTLYSWPQLGGAAVLSGVVGAYIIRQLVNGSQLDSGRYLISLSDSFSLRSQDELIFKKEIIKNFN